MGEGKAIQDIPPQESSQVPVKGGHDTCKDDKYLTILVQWKIGEKYFNFWNLSEYSNTELKCPESGLLRNAHQCNEEQEIPNIQDGW